jgi:hypothetical protein
MSLLKYWEVRVLFLDGSQKVFEVGAETLSLALQRLAKSSLFPGSPGLSITKMVVTFVEDNPGEVT